MKKTLRIILSAILALTLAAGLSTTVFAADGHTVRVIVIYDHHHGTVYTGEVELRVDGVHVSSIPLEEQLGDGSVSFQTTTGGEYSLHLLRPGYVVGTVYINGDPAQNLDLGRITANISVMFSIVPGEDPEPPAATPDPTPEPTPTPTVEVTEDTEVRVYNRSGVLSIYVDGINLGVDGFLQNNRSMVPLRVFSELLGIPVDWTGSLRRVTLHHPDGDVFIFIDSTVVEGSTRVLDSPPVLRGGTTFVPIRFVLELFGVNPDNLVFVRE